MSSLPIGLRRIGLESPSGNRESKREDCQFPILLPLIVLLLGLLLLGLTAPLPIILPLPLSLTCDGSDSSGTGEAFSAGRGEEDDVGRCERDWDTAADENEQRRREGGAKAEAKAGPESTT